MGRRKKYTDKEIVKWRDYRSKRESITPFQYGSYRDTKGELGISSDIISRAERNIARKTKGANPRGWNLKKGHIDGDYGRSMSKYSHKNKK